MGISETICLLFTYILKKFKIILKYLIYFDKNLYFTSTKKKIKLKNYLMND